MSEMVERGAAALRELPIRDVENPGSELDQLRLREAVRAVIRAMRDPTDVMISASIKCNTEPEAYLHKQRWQSMIDAALK